MFKSGASGGPVFNQGRVVAINCRAWDFLDEGDNLSYLTPIGYLLEMEIDLFMLPADSWEAKQSPDGHNQPITVRDLIVGARRMGALISLVMFAPVALRT